MTCCATCGRPLPSPSGITVDDTRGTVEFNGLSARLPLIPLAILKALIRAPNRAVPQERLFTIIYGTSGHAWPEHPNTLRVNVHRLRKLIAPLGLTITTVYDAGIVLNAPAQEQRKAA